MSDSQRDHGLRRFVQKVVSHPLHVRMVKILIRNALVHEKSYKFRRDVVGAMRSFEFEETEFKDVKGYENHNELVKATLARVKPELTTWIEMGVMTGSSIRLFLKEAEKLSIKPDVHGFDSFEGMPEDWTKMVSKGDLAHPMPHFKEDNVKLHKGWFDDTLPKFAKDELTQQIGFLHVDSDLYSSAKTGFDAFREFLKPGTVILFDDYWNYAEFADHEVKAFKEFIADSGLDFEYIGYNRHHMQASVVLK